MEVISPGALPNGMTIEKMKAGRRTPRNAIILEVMRDYGYVDARGMGLMGCVQCSYERDKNSSLENDYELGALIDAECQKNGLVLRPIINMCVMSPPLVISDGQINQMFDILGRAIKTVATSRAL